MPNIFIIFIILKNIVLLQNRKNLDIKTNLNGNKNKKNLKSDFLDGMYDCPSAAV